MARPAGVTTTVTTEYAASVVAAATEDGARARAGIGLGSIHPSRNDFRVASISQIRIRPSIASGPVLLRFKGPGPQAVTVPARRTRSGCHGYDQL